MFKHGRRHKHKIKLRGGLFDGQGAPGAPLKGPGLPGNRTPETGIRRGNQSRRLRPQGSITTCTGLLVYVAVLKLFRRGFANVSNFTFKAQ